MRVLTVALILACGALTHAAEPPADAKARAALALAKAKLPAVVATAPAPRPAVLDYPAAKQIALERNLPVVVFVGCDAQRVPEALTAAVERMEGVAAGTVLVCYPSGGSLWADAALKCGAEPAEIARAAKVAGKKVDAKPVAGKRLDWS